MGGRAYGNPNVLCFLCRFICSQSTLDIRQPQVQGGREGRLLQRQSPFKSPTRIHLIPGALPEMTAAIQSLSLHFLSQHLGNISRKIGDTCCLSLASDLGIQELCLNG